MLASDNKRLLKFATYFSVSIASLILILKTYGWVMTESQSMLASFIDSLLDISSSLINVLAVRFALEPPDNNHRFGHEKFQDLAVFSQGMFFIASSLFTIFSSIKGLVTYQEIANHHVGASIMYICVFLTLILVIFQTWVLKRTKSSIIEAEKLHYLSDLLTNIVVIISIKLSYEYPFLDSIFGILISFYIMYGSYNLLKNSIKNLVDEEFEEEERQKILQVISAYKEVKGVHDLKTRKASNKVFIQVHIEMDCSMTLLEAHSLSEMITKDLLKVFPGGDIIIHQDPEGALEKVYYREQIKI